MVFITETKQTRTREWDIAVTIKTIFFWENCGGIRNFGLEKLLSAYTLKRSLGSFEGKMLRVVYVMEA